MSVRSLLMAAAGASTAPAYRYWRIYMQTNNGDPTYTALCEIELRSSVGGADLTTSSTPAASSTSYSAAYDASKTVDESTSTLWISAFNSTTNQWLRYDLGSAQTVAQVAIYPQGDALSRAPKDFIIQGSNDGTNFTNVKSITNATGWTAAWRTFNI